MDFLFDSGGYDAGILGGFRLNSSMPSTPWWRGHHVIGALASISVPDDSGSCLEAHPCPSYTASRNRRLLRNVSTQHLRHHAGITCSPALLSVPVRFATATSPQVDAVVNCHGDTLLTCYIESTTFWSTTKPLSPSHIGQPARTQSSRPRWYEYMFLVRRRRRIDVYQTIFSRYCNRK